MLHLTVQNPALHTRIFYKLALSQIAMGWKVSVAGQHSTSMPCEKEGVTIYPIQPFSRLSFQRLLLRGRLFNLVRELRPDAVTIHAPELLPLAVRMHKAFGTKIWYDVHEDYQLDLHHAAHFPGWMRKPLGDAVRGIELRSLKHIAVVSYAEESYSDVLGAGEKATVLPNLFTDRSLTSPSTMKIPKSPYFLFSGTLARERGAFSAIEIWEELFPITGHQLVIAGQSSREQVVEALRERIQESPYEESIRLIGGSEFVPYADIVALIQNCYAGFGIYEPQPHLIGKLPTKFYEHLALGRPLIYPAVGPWKEFGERVELGVGMIPEMSGQEIVSRLEKWKTGSSVQEFTWEDEAVEKLLEKMRD